MCGRYVCGWHKCQTYFASCILSTISFLQIDGRTNRNITFAQLDEQINYVTSRLVSLFGLTRGHVVCLCGLNAPEFAHVFCSVTALGAALTIANAQLTAGGYISLPRTVLKITIIDNLKMCSPSFSLKHAKSIHWNYITMTTQQIRYANPFKCRYCSNMLCTSNQIANTHRSWFTFKECTLFSFFYFLKVSCVLR